MIYLIEREKMSISIIQPLKDEILEKTTIITTQSQQIDELHQNIESLKTLNLEFEEQINELNVKERNLQSEMNLLRLKFKDFETKQQTDLIGMYLFVIVCLI